MENENDEYEKLVKEMRECNIIKKRCINEKDFLNMTHDQKLEAVKYVAMVKKALEMEGAIVLVTREVLK